MSLDDSERNRWCLEAGNYRLWKINDPNWPYWLENKDNEGMSLSEHDVAEMLDKYFRENF